MPPVIPLDPDDHFHSTHNGTYLHNQFLSGYLESPFSSTETEKEKDTTGGSSILAGSNSINHYKDM